MSVKHSISHSQNVESFGFVKSRLYNLTSHWRRKFVQFVADDIRSRNPRSALDIGCGTGDILVHLRGSGIELFGIDPSPFMLELAKKNIGRANPHSLPPVNLCRGNNRRIPFDREFDIIFSSLSFHHWEERNKSIPAILAKLSRRGEFVIYEYDRETLSFLRRSVMGKHSLSKADVEALHFDGYTKRVAHSGSVIIVSLHEAV